MPGSEYAEGSTLRVKLNLPENETLVRTPEINTITKFVLSDNSLHIMVGDTKRDPELGFVTGTSITGNQESVNLAYVLSATKYIAISYCVKTEQKGTQEVIEHWYQFHKAHKVEIKKTGKRYFVFDADTFGLGMMPLYDNVLFADGIQGDLDTYEELAEESLEEITEQAEIQAENRMDAAEHT